MGTAPNEDYGSFEVNKMMVQTDQLLHIKEATDIYSLDHEAKVQGRKKTLVQELKQFPTCFYCLYEKGKTHAMVSLKGLHLGDALGTPTFLLVWGWSHSAPGAIS